MIYENYNNLFVFYMNEVFKTNSKNNSNLKELITENTIFETEENSKLNNISKNYNFGSNLNSFFDIDEFLDKNGYTFYHYKLIFYASLFFFIDGSEKIVINIMLSTIKEEWKLSTIQRSFLSSSIFLGFFFGSLISGFINNNHGRVFPIKICIFIVFISSLISSTSPNLIFLFILRSLIGLCMGIIIPSIQTLVVESIPNKNRGFVLNFIWVLFYF